MSKNVLCHYHYDPLDQLVITTLMGNIRLQRFYCRNLLITEIQGLQQYSIFQPEGRALAQKLIKKGSVEVRLLATNSMNSVTQVVEETRSNSIVYSPHGYTSMDSSQASVLGFNGQRSDPVTGCYLLGNGFRAFNPALMRFVSPDKFSPFDRGGINPYSYCLGDPINREDSTGRVSWLRGMEATLRIFHKSSSRLLRSLKSKTTVKSGSFSRNENFENDTGSQNFLKNTSPSQTKYEYRDFENFQNEIDKSLVRSIVSNEDLSALKLGYHYKFVFTDQRQLVVGGFPDVEGYSYLSHPVLSQYASSQKIVSAGYIARQGFNFYEVDNLTGHYKAPYEALPPVGAYLRGLGASVKLVRYTNHGP